MAPLLPVDGVFDESVEAFDLDVSAFVPTGDHLVAVRVFDQSGNSVVRDVEVEMSGCFKSLHWGVLSSFRRGHRDRTFLMMYRRVTYLTLRAVAAALCAAAVGLRRDAGNAHL